MSIKAVIDTNVLVSAFWTRNPKSPTAKIAQALLSGRFTALINDDIISEYDDVLHRAKFGFAEGDVNAMISYIKAVGEEIVPADSDEGFPDPTDKVFFCTALAGKGNLVTGNLKHYPKSAIVVTPAEFCKLARL